MKWLIMCENTYGHWSYVWSAVVWQRHHEDLAATKKKMGGCTQAFLQTETSKAHMHLVLCNRLHVSFVIYFTIQCKS